MREEGKRNTNQSGEEQSGKLKLKKLHIKISNGGVPGWRRWLSG